MKDNNAEIFPFVDADGNVLGSMTRGEAHNGCHKLHPVVHLHVFNSRGELFLQRRPAWKDIQPGKWDTAVGGHVAYGETVEQALRREVNEEIGITGYTPVALGHYVFDSNVESELVYMHTTTYDGRLFPSADELDGGHFWTFSEIENAIGKDVFTPNFEHEYILYLRPIMQSKSRE